MSNTSCRPPNLIFFFTDQQRWDTCGCYGQPLPVTPHLDAMAAEGVRFEQAFTCQPVCGPARAALQTGQYPDQVGCFTNGRALPLDQPGLAHWLTEAGYEVGYIGKWHLASDKDHNFSTVAVPPERRGGYRDYWLASDVLEFTSHGYDGHLWDAEGRQVNFTGYRADCLTDYVVDYLHTRTGERPFFLFVSYIEPHHQNDHHCYEGPHGSKEQWADYEAPGDLVGTAGDWRENYPDYLGCCHALDRGLGRVRETLAELGLADETLLVYTSDHGSHFCTRNSEYKRSCHDGCLRIPLVACGPGFRGGQVVSELASLLDVPPTLLAAAGAELPPSLAGRPLQQALAHDPGWPAEVFAQISESQVGRCIRTHRWKYSVSLQPPPEGAGWQQAYAECYTEEYLYDLSADPHERSNLVADPAYAAVRGELAEVLKRRIRQHEGREARIVPAGESRCGE